ncbi:MAG: gamma-glutamyltransferase, partial [Methylococcales bacterium]
MTALKKLIVTIILCLSPIVNAEMPKAAIASAHPLAIYAGFEILEQGGNAFDAAVAVSAALAVVEPSGSGLGGGGFWLLHRASDSFETMLDGREKAPLAADKNMFLDAKGNIIKGLSRNSVLAAGIPGLPAAIVHLSEKYGRLPLSQVLQPAIRYAKQGFIIGDKHRKLLNYRLAVLQKNKAAADIFLVDNKMPKQGGVLKQTDLAATLEKIAQFGRAGFYEGGVAEKMLKAVQQAGGIWTQKDLTQYQVIEREPIKGDYKGVKVTSAALPSSGGIVLLEALNIL